jgi:hypothetical protein
MWQLIKTSVLQFFMPIVYVTAWLLKKLGRYKVIGRVEDDTWKPYLERFYVLRMKWFNIYLHRFWASDSDIYLHQHPFCFGNLILKHGYDEVMVDDVYTRKPGYFKVWRDANELHRILLAPGTEGEVWTLFWRGKKFQRWGFMVNGKLIDSEEYLSGNNIMLEGD